MYSLKEFLPEIIEQLKRINIYKIILFGSLSHNLEKSCNDIDLIVILDSNEISKNFDEKMKNKLMVRRSIYEISKKVPIDLLVYTKKEFELIQKNKNAFFKEINNTGKIIYEKAS